MSIRGVVITGIIVFMRIPPSFFASVDPVGGRKTSAVLWIDASKEGANKFYDLFCNNLGENKKSVISQCALCRFGKKSTCRL